MREYSPSFPFAVRSYMGIILMLTVTITAFDPEGSGLDNVALDYASLLPLLTISVSVALVLTRNFVFYETQRCRGDIRAIPEVLRQPENDDIPLVIRYDGDLNESCESVFDFNSDFEGDLSHLEEFSDEPSNLLHDRVSQEDIEAQFEARSISIPKTCAFSSRFIGDLPPRKLSLSSHEASSGKPASPLVPRKKDTSRPLRTPSPRKKAPKTDAYSDRLDELLSVPFEGKRPTPSPRRLRTCSSGLGSDFVSIDSCCQDFGFLNVATPDRSTPRGHRRTFSGSSTSFAALVHVSSYGQVDPQYPSVMNQARIRSASSPGFDRRHMIPNSPRSGHEYQNHYRGHSFSQGF